MSLVNRCGNLVALKILMYAPLLVHTSLHSHLLLSLPFPNMNWVGFISFMCMLVAIVLWPFNIVKIERICYAYASHITLQFMPIYVCTKPGGSPLMDYLLQRTYLHIHLHLLRIEVIRSWYVGHFHQKTSLT